MGALDSDAPARHIPGMVVAVERDVSVGRVLARTLGVLRTHPLTVLGTALLLGALPRWGLDWLQLRLLRAASDGPAGAIGFFFLSAAIGLILSMLVQGAIVRAVVAHAAGERVGWARSIAAGLAAAVPLAGLAILSGLAVGVGLVVALVPGLLLFVIWAVAAPALVTERIGVFAALARSQELTAGARWQVLGIELLATVLYYALSAIVVLVGIGLGSSPAMLWMGAGGGWEDTLVTLAAHTIRSALWAALQTALYVELRDWKDGPAAQQLAAIFA